MSTRPRRIGSRVLGICACAAVIVFASGATNGWADTIEEEEPIPASIEQSLTAIERAFRPPPPPPATLLPELRQELKDAPPFIRDAQIEFNLRSFYRNLINADQSKSEAWAGGGAISLRSGWLADSLSVGGTFYTSQPLYAPQDRDGTQLLQAGQRGYSALGELYARFRITEDNYFTAGRYTYDTPYLSRFDIRMTPYTFQGYVLQGSAGGGDGQPSIRYGAGYISDVKPWTSEGFISMSRAAGANVDRGVASAGALLSFQNFSVGAIDYYSSDIINIGYAEAKYVTRLPEKLDVMLSAQYVDQRSVGSDLLASSSFSTNLVGVRSEIGREGAILTFAYTAAGTGAALRRPWSGNPVYTGSLLLGFDRAGEQAALVKLSYDFSRMGLPGVSAYAHYALGWVPASAAGISSLSERELDLSVQWRPEWQVLKGVWVRGMYCLAETSQGGTQPRLRDFRLIANYTFLLF